MCNNIIHYNNKKFDLNTLLSEPTELIEYNTKKEKKSSQKCITELKPKYTVSCTGFTFEKKIIPHTLALKSFNKKFELIHGIHSF